METVKYNNLDVFAAYNKEAFVILRLIKDSGYEAAEFRPANKGERYFDAGLLRPEIWTCDVAMPGIPRFILKPLPPSEYEYKVKWEQIYRQHSLEELREIAKNQGYELSEFRLPRFSEYYLADIGTMVCQYKSSDLVRLPRFILKKSEKRFFNPKGQNACCTIGVDQVYPENKEVDITGYKVIGFRIPKPLDYYIPVHGNICQLPAKEFHMGSQPRWILEKI